MRCFGYYWLNFQFMLEEIKERYGFYIACVLVVVLLGFIEALRDVLMGL